MCHALIESCALVQVLQVPYIFPLGMEVIQTGMSGSTTSSQVTIVIFPEIRGLVRSEKSVMIAWAYGTGSADQEEDDYNAYKMVKSGVLMRMNTS
jgi:hypothetical protein